MPKTEEEIRQRVAENLTNMRKQKGLTQSELAELINYSDKSVSKWERAEGVPDLYIMVQLAEIFGVNVNDFLAEENSAPTIKGQMAPLSWRSKLLIMVLAVGLVVLFGAVVYFVLALVGLSGKPLNLALFCAVPISAIVTTVFTLLWFPKWSSALSITVLIWSIAYVLFRFIELDGIRLIFGVAAVLQVLLCLWYLLLAIRNREKKKQKK